VTEHRVLLFIEYAQCAAHWNIPWELRKILWDTHWYNHPMGGDWDPTVSHGSQLVTMGSNKTCL